MPWQRKEHVTPIEYETVSGLSFLNGDLYARHFQQRQLEGQKYATVTFPSGLTREVEQTDHHVTVHVLSGLKLPLAGDLDTVYAYAERRIHQFGLRIAKVGRDRLKIWRPDAGEAFVLWFENSQIVDIVRQVEPGSRALPRPMELLNTASRAVLPSLYTNEHLGLDAVAPIKFFTPTSDWTWYPTEYDGADLFFGLVSGFEVELGYFSLAELETVRGPLGLPIERDLYFQPQSLRVLKQLHEDLR